jgi:hypothetical protein
MDAPPSPTATRPAFSATDQVPSSIVVARVTPLSAAAIVIVSVIAVPTEPTCPTLTEIVPESALVATNQASRTFIFL